MYPLPNHSHLHQHHHHQYQQPFYPPPPPPPHSHSHSLSHSHSRDPRRHPANTMEYTHQPSEPFNYFPTELSLETSGVADDPTTITHTNTTTTTTTTNTSSHTAELCVPPHLLYPPSLLTRSPPYSPAPTMDPSGTPQPDFDTVSLPHENFSLKRRSPSPAPSHSSMSTDFSSTHSSRVHPIPPTKKARNERGERINSKDFVPPDVSGLSKREARLVKNRAAAFLSRQRKREEFEALEIRVADLEAENAQLRNGKSVVVSRHSDSKADDLQNEIARLRSELSTSSKRCSLLQQDLKRVRSQQQELQANRVVKSEPVEEDLSDVEDTSPSGKLTLPPAAPPSVADSDDSKPSTPKEKASGLMMALLLLLAPVLSNPSASQHHHHHHHHHQNSSHQSSFSDGYAIPNRFDYGLFDHQSPSMNLAFDHLLHSDLGWSSSTPSTSRSDSFDWNASSTSSDESDLDLLSGSMGMGSDKGKRQVELDVELVRDPSNPDRVKVRIVEPSSASSKVQASQYSFSAIGGLDSFSSLALSPNGFPLSSPPSSSTGSDFLGFPNIAPAFTSSPEPLSLTLPLSLDSLPTSYSYTTSNTNEKKRVRISVGESGEWEVEVK